MLPKDVRDFWYAACDLSERTIRTRWGAVVTDSRYPRIYDANNAAILEPDPSLSIEEIRLALHPAAEEAGVRFEHLEFWETSADSPALVQMRRTGQLTRPDVVMTLDVSPDGLPQNEIDVRELTAPDAQFWPWYRISRNEFGESLPDDVLDQLLRRDREVFVPAGIRFFVARVDEERAGYTTLLSLAGVGHLDGVVTMPGFRRRGVATATIRAAARASRAAGDRTLFLLAEEGGDPHRLYERLGFRVRARVESFNRSLAPE